MAYPGVGNQLFLLKFENLTIGRPFQCPLLPGPGRYYTLLNRFKEAYTWVLANETTPIVISLKNCSSHNFFGLLTDIFDHFWIQVGVSLPKRPYHSRLGSETVINL
jgi:hypothetical protein